jgi:hypothetical protein
VTARVLLGLMTKIFDIYSLHRIQMTGVRAPSIETMAPVT